MYKYLKYKQKYLNLLAGSKAEAEAEAKKAEDKEIDQVLEQAIEEKMKIMESTPQRDFENLVFILNYLSKKEKKKKNFFQLLEILYESDVFKQFPQNLKKLIKTANYKPLLSIPDFIENFTSDYLELYYENMKYLLEQCYSDKDFREFLGLDDDFTKGIGEKYIKTTKKKKKAKVEAEEEAKEAEEKEAEAGERKDHLLTDLMYSEFKTQPDDDDYQDDVMNSGDENSGYKTQEESESDDER
jgi:hypothetical protein